MNYSFWEKKIIESSTDITILGSGITGLSTAISIKEKRPDLTIKILERGSMPYGASTKNAGFSCFGSVSELLDDIQSMGEADCMEVVQMRWQGLQKLTQRVGKKELEYQDCGGTELFRRHNDLKQSCLDHIAYCNDLMSRHLGLSDCYKAVKNEVIPGFDTTSIFNQYEGSINPVSMMMALTRQAISLGVQIFYGVEVMNINNIAKTLTTPHLHISYQKLVVCTNGFAQQLLPALEVLPARNQVLITKPIPGLCLPSCYHIDQGYVYFRQYQNRILLGGGRNKDRENETTSLFGNSAVIQQYLTDILEEIHPGAAGHIDHWWSGILGIGTTKYPICTWVENDILVGVRLGGMGVAIGSYLGEQLANTILVSQQ